MLAREKKDRRVIIDIIPCLETYAFVAIVAYFDMLTVRENPAWGREQGTQRSVAILKEKKTSKVVYLKTQIQWISILRKFEELGLNASAGHTWNSLDAPGTKLNSDPKRWSSWAKSLRARFWGTTTWGNLTTSRLYKQSSVEFGEKICKLKAEDNYVLVSCEGAEDSGASMHNAEQRRIKLKFDGYFEQVQNPISDLPRLWTVQINE